MVDDAAAIGCRGARGGRARRAAARRRAPWRRSRGRGRPTPDRPRTAPRTPSSPSRSPAALTTTRDRRPAARTPRCCAARRRGLLDAPGVQRQRAAASLRGGRLTPQPSAASTDRRLVDVSERQPLHTAGQQRHLRSVAARPASGAGIVAHRPQRRPSRVARAWPAGATALPDPTPAALRATSRLRPAEERQRASAQRMPRGIRHDAISSARNSRRRRPRIAVLDLRARALDERRVLHARRTRRHARQAAQAGSKCSTNEGVSSTRPSTPAFIR